MMGVYILMDAVEAEENVQSHASQWERRWVLKSFSVVAGGGSGLA